MTCFLAARTHDSKGTQDLPSLPQRKPANNELSSLRTPTSHKKGQKTESRVVSCPKQPSGCLMMLMTLSTSSAASCGLVRKERPCGEMKTWEASVRRMQTVPSGFSPDNHSARATLASGEVRGNGEREKEPARAGEIAGKKEARGVR